MALAIEDQNHMSTWPYVTVSAEKYIHFFPQHVLRKKIIIIRKKKNLPEQVVQSAYFNFILVHASDRARKKYSVLSLYIFYINFKKIIKLYIQLKGNL